MLATFAFAGANDEVRLARLAAKGLRGNCSLSGFFRRQVHDQTLLTTGHGDVDFGQDLGIKQGAVQRAV